MATRFTRTSTPKYAVVRQNFDLLVKVANQAVGEFATKAFSKELINKELMKQATGDRPTNAITIEIMSAILDKIEYKDSHFDSLVQILNAIPSLRSLAEDLVAELEAPPSLSIQESGSSQSALLVTNSEQDVANGDDEITEVFDKLKNLRSELQQTKAQNHHYIAKSTELQEKVDTLEGELIETKESLKTKKEEVVRVTTDKDAEISTLSAKVGSLHAEVDKLQDSLENHQSEMDQMKKQHEKELQAVKECSNVELAKVKVKLANADKLLVLTQLEKEREISKSKDEIREIMEKKHELELQVRVLKQTTETEKAKREKCEQKLDIQRDGHKHGLECEFHEYIAAAQPSSEPTLKLLLQELMSVADEWENIGVFLEINDGELKAIKSDEQNVRNRLREMLRLWLKQADPPPTWQAVVEAVRKIGNQLLAEELRKKYCG